MRAIHVGLISLVGPVAAVTVACPCSAEVGEPSGSGVNYKDMFAWTPGGPRHDLKIRTDAAGVVIFTATPSGYGPQDFRSAYGLPATGGNGRLVAVYADQDFPQVESDLAVYRQAFGLPPCTTANGCFQRIDEYGGTTKYPAPGTNDGENALDAEMVSATCPDCKIALIEGGDPQTAIATIAGMGGVAISFSVQFGIGSPADWCASYANSTSGLVVTASMGDTGYPGTRDWVPTACQGTLAVGGTTLTRASNTRGWHEVAWAGTGGGCSSYVAQPPWQHVRGCSMRMTADVSAVADPGTGVAFYATLGCGGWGVVGGTSASAPLVAGALAVVGVANGHFTPEWVWNNTSAFFDITSGSNGTCAGSPHLFCNAGAGYDGPTGWGTPNGPLLMAAATSAGSPPPPCAAVPAGSYLDSCSGCATTSSMGSCVLECQTCAKIDGSENPDPTLALPCDGTVSNDDGTLVCDAPSDAGAGPDADAAGSPVVPPGVSSEGGGDAAADASTDGAADAATAVRADAMAGPSDEGGLGTAGESPSGGTEHPPTLSACLCSMQSEARPGGTSGMNAGVLLLGAFCLRRRARRIAARRAASASRPRRG